MITVGIDEVGRGCWAGPLVAAAVILPENFDALSGGITLADSKKMTKKQRDEACAVIQDLAMAHGLGWVDAPTIDRVGVSTAVRWAMERALESIGLYYDRIIIDGSINFLPGHSKALAVVKADASVPSVSAASIVAKVARDAYMADIAHVYPRYGFEKHVGYGTALHQQMLKLHGASELHRKSYKPVQAVMQAV